MKGRPPTPMPVARQLRQEAGFGCCRCGCPIVEYHHIIPWEAEQHFRPEDMMVLCPMCHRQVTVGAMSVFQQRQYKRSPVNIQRGYVGGHLIINQSVPAIVVGSVEFVGDGAMISIDGIPLLTLFRTPDGRLELSVDLYDQSNRLLATIARNEWRSHVPLLWDIESGFQWLRIRESKRKISLDIDARGWLVKVRGSLWFNHQTVGLTRDGIQYLRGGMSELCLVGESLDFHPSQGNWEIRPDGRFGRGYFISNDDRFRRVVDGMNDWMKMVHPQWPWSSSA